MSAVADGPQAPVRVDDVTVTDPRVVRRAVTAAAVGNITEWYDFGVYGYFVLTLQRVFFSGLPEAASLIATFGVFASSFLVRPFGGLIFGPLGDRIGRTKVLSMTVILMALGTFCIGLIPSYDSIGVAAPLLVLLAKLVQGLSTGGEYGGTMTFIAEYASDRRRGFFGSWLESGTLTGYSMGAGTVAVLSAVLSTDQLLSWGYRIPFLLALPLGLVGLYLRLRMDETPAFEDLLEESGKREGHSAKRVFRDIFVKHWRAVLLCGGIVIAWNITGYMLTSYLPTYLAVLPEYGVPSVGQTVAQFMQIAVLAILIVVIPLLGGLGDRVGRRPLLAAGCGALIVLAIPSLWLLRAGSHLATFSGLLMIGLTLVCFSATAPSTLPALFPTDVRYGALTTSYNTFVSAFGGTTSVVMGALVSATHDLNWPAYYMIGAGVVGAGSVYLIREPNSKSLPGSTPAVESKREARGLVRSVARARDRRRIRDRSSSTR